MKDERMRGGKFQWYLIILLLLCLKRQGSFIWLQKNTVPRLSEYNDGMSL